MPNISVIVPVYKVEPYLHRCVNSLLAQTYSDFELILVDDGSPDNCGQMCEEIAKADARVHVIHQENGGLSAARNTGIDWAMANSASEWLAFVDSDDWVDKTYLAQLYRAVTESGCVLSACRFYTTKGEKAPERSDDGCRVLSADEFYCNDQDAVATAAVAVCKLYHRSLFEFVRYPVGKLHEDEFTTYRLVYAAETVAVIPGELYAYFQNDAGIMRSKWSPRRMHALEAVEQQIAFARTENHPALLHKAVEQYIYSTYGQMNQLSDLPEGEQYRGLLKKKLRWGLKQARVSGTFPKDRNILWAYEAAYPAKPFWWLLGKLRKG